MNKNNSPYLVLSGAEKVRENITMYIGDRSTPTQLVTEIFDNVLDEIASGRANIGKIKFNEDNSITITDNGDGFEVYSMQIPDTNMVKDSVEALCTELHSGGKFTQVKSTKSESIGLHGIGLVATNALSEWMIIKTRNKTNKRKSYTYNFLDFNLYSKEINDKESVKEDWSTIITFKPSATFFKSLDINRELILNSILIAQAKYPKATFFINDKEIPKITTKDLIKNKLDINDEEFNNFYHFELSKFNKNKEKLELDCYIQFIEDQNTDIYSLVNLKECSGLYIDQFKDILRNIIVPKLDKKYSDITNNLLLLGLRLYISLSLGTRLEFEAQIKNKLSLDLKEDLIKYIEPYLNKYINENNVIETIKQNIELKFNKSSNKKTRNKRISNSNKVKDSINIPGKRLYIVEGDSAAGTIKAVRDKHTEGVFPTKGKSLNMISKSLVKIHNNEELKDLKEAIGPVNNRRYDEIVWLADADADGLHINVIGAMNSYLLFPDYIEKQKISIIIPPLYSARKGNTYIPLYKIEDFEQYKTKGYILNRFKG